MAATAAVLLLLLEPWAPPSPAGAELLTPAPDDSAEASNYTVWQGDNATLSCALDAEVTRVAWLNRSQLLFAGGDKWSRDPRVRLVARGPPHFAVAIAGVGPQDEGPYTCALQTPARPRTARLFLSVQVPAHITEVSGPVTVDEGGDVTLRCLAAGRPEPSVSWRLPRATGATPGELLAIGGIRRGQAGRYLCEATNGVAQPDTRAVAVTVNYPPSITEARGARPPPGQPALLRCDALGEPPPTFQWFKDERPLQGEAPGGPRVRSERLRSLLLFPNVTRSHYGNYTCRAANALGLASARLRLLHPGPTDDAPPLLAAVLALVLTSLVPAL